ncbi:hypothetical protein I79_023946 [Cricetulus griseus]|uniref:Secreted protein n=1 Tax=Cricetulus griseus TaxID=10029 RepID=G3IJB4_CRIGR|nr:hypothetical protein I79_023946 [Cricetulus griseus]
MKQGRNMSLSVALFVELSPSLSSHTYGGEEQSLHLHISMQMEADRGVCLLTLFFETGSLTEPGTHCFSPIVMV